MKNDMKRKTVVVILGMILLSLPFFQSTNAAILGYTKEGYPACASLFDFQTMYTCYVQNDYLAVNKMIEQGRCILLRQGIEVYAWRALSETHPDWAKIRLPGSPETLWTFWQAVEEKKEKVPEQDKSISFAPTMKEKYILLKSLPTIRPQVSKKQDVIQRYGKPFLENREELRYETGQHPDFKEWVRVKFIFDESGVLQEIRAVLY